MSNKRYDPADDEPSVWGTERQQPSTEWLLWYSKRNKIGIVRAHDVGLALIKRLEQERPQSVKE